MLITKKKYRLLSEGLNEEISDLTLENQQLITLLANVHNSHQEELSEALKYQTKYQDLYESVHDALGKGPRYKSDYLTNGEVDNVTLNTQTWHAINDKLAGTIK